MLLSLYYSACGLYRWYSWHGGLKWVYRKQYNLCEGQVLVVGVKHMYKYIVFFCNKPRFTLTLNSAAEQEF